MSETEGDGTIYALNRYKASFALELISDLISEQGWQPADFVCISNLSFLEQFSASGTPLPGASNFVVELLVGENGSARGDMKSLQSSVSNIIRLADPDYIDCAEMAIRRSGDAYFLSADVRLLWKVT